MLKKIALGIVVIIGLGTWIKCTETIKPGMGGVVYSANGGIEEQILSQGWHFVAPWKDVTPYPISTQTVYLTKSATEGNKNDDSFNVSTKEGKPVNVDVMYSLHMDPAKLPHIFTKFKGAEAESIEKSFVKQQVKAKIQEVTSQYSVMDVYGEKRGEIQKKIEDSLIEKDSILHEDGIVIESFTFGEIRPDENSMKAIQDKVDAQQKLQQMEIEKQQAAITADKVRIEAQASADKAVIEAKGKAEANAKVQASLTKELIQYELVKQLPSITFPKVMGGGTNILNMPAELLKDEKK
jgi:regulator of protease activity HflC (stomatin/prohibitin superfamily)